MKCNECLQQYDVEYRGVPTGANVPKFCAYCGSVAVVAHREDMYWRDLSESLGFGRQASGVQLTQQLYNMWPTQTYSRFRDFVEHEMREQT